MLLLNDKTKEAKYVFRSFINTLIYLVLLVAWLFLTVFLGEMITKVLFWLDLKTYPFLGKGIGLIIWTTWPFIALIIAKFIMRAPSKAHRYQLVKIQPTQRLTTSVEQSSALEEVTSLMTPERRMY